MYGDTRLTGSSPVARWIADGGYVRVSAIRVSAPIEVGRMNRIETSVTLLVVLLRAEVWVGNGIEMGWPWEWPSEWGEATREANGSGERGQCTTLDTSYVNDLQESCGFVHHVHCGIKCILRSVNMHLATSVTEAGMKRGGEGEMRHPARRPAKLEGEKKTSALRTWLACRRRVKYSQPRVAMPHI